MDCNVARQLLEFARPGAAELDADDAAALERHLAACPECGPPARSERAFHAALARAMHGVAPPDGARLRLHTRLLAARMAWWRRTLLGALTAAVALLLAVSAGVYWGRPTLDPYAVIQKVYEQTGLWRTNDEAREVVTSWLRQLDERLQAPEDLNYKLLISLERSDFQGLRSVPTMVFVRGGDATMRVYVVRAHAFKNLRAFAEQPVEDGGCTVAVRRYPELRDWVFVVVTAGAPFDAFLRPTRPVPPA
jgi:hypothetical protein